jgi:carnitine O-acetyltransferase
MNYLIGKTMIKVGIESKKSCPETKTCKFRSTLRGVLMDLRLFVENVSAVPNL